MPDIFSIRYHESFMADYADIKNEVIKSITEVIKDGNSDHPYASGGSIILTPGGNKQFDLSLIPNSSKIIHFIEEQIKVYWDDLGYRKDCVPYLKNIWTSYNPSGGSWTSHNHAPSALAGCFYLNASPAQGNIVFEHPLELVLGYQPLATDMPDLLLNHTVTAEDGKLLLFPGWLKHKVQVNTTDIPRMIIGLDIHYRSA